ncbi:MAG: hypothetical protein OHK0046_04040 [Anaerolineae bacterium]
MSLEPVSSKYISEIEQQVSQLLASMRKAKLYDEPVYTKLQEFEQKLGEVRRSRFDQKNSEYSDY